MSRFDLTTDLATMNPAFAFREESPADLFPVDCVEKRRKRQPEETDELCHISHFTARWWPATPDDE